MVRLCIFVILILCIPTISSASDRSPSPRPEVLSNNNPKVLKAIEEAKKKIAKRNMSCDNPAILIYKARTWDNKQFHALSDLYICRNGDCDSGYYPAGTSKGKVNSHVACPSMEHELRVKIQQNSFYHEFSKKITFKKGEVVIWDDIVLEPVTPETDVELNGKIILEGSAGASGIKVAFGRNTTLTDANGLFTLAGLPAGNNYILKIYKDGYLFDGRVDLKKDTKAMTILKGYRKKVAQIRWEYIPSGIDRLIGTKTKRGIAEFKSGNYVDIKKDFAATRYNKNADFSVFQKEGSLSLTLRAKGAGIYKTSFDYNDLKEVPSNMQPRSSQYIPEMKEGDTYIIKASDGSSFAKMQIQRIVAE